MTDEPEREPDADQVEDLLASYIPPGAEVDPERFRAAMAYEIDRHSDREEILARHATGQWWWYITRHDTGAEALLGFYQKRLLSAGSLWGAGRRAAAGTDERRFIAMIPLANILRRPEG
jgi:hypothetical protein